MAARAVLNSKKIRFDGVIVIGCLVKGATQHFEYIADAVTHGIMKLNLDNDLNPYMSPVIYGVLTVQNTDQALERAGLAWSKGEGGDESNSGIEWARTLIESIS